VRAVRGRGGGIRLACGQRARELSAVTAAPRAAAQRACAVHLLLSHIPLYLHTSPRTSAHLPSQWEARAHAPALSSRPRYVSPQTGHVTCQYHATREVLCGQPHAVARSRSHSPPPRMVRSLPPPPHPSHCGDCLLRGAGGTRAHAGGGGSVRRCAVASGQAMPVASPLAWRSMLQMRLGLLLPS